MGSLKLPQSQWRGRTQLRNELGSPRCYPWEWNSAEHNTLRQLEDIYMQSLDASDKFDERRKEVKNQSEGHKRFTPEGMHEHVTEQLAAYVGKEVSPKLKKVFGQLQNVKAQIDAKRKEFKAVTPREVTDLAGAIRDAEIRTFLRSIDEGAKTPLLLGQNADPEYVAATLRGKAIESGVGAALYQELCSVALKARHGAELEEAATLDAALERAAKALQVVSTDIKQQSGKHPLE